MINFGNQLTALRRSRGLTQRQLAAMVGVSPGAVSKWETNASCPDVSLLCPIARALSATVDELLQFEDALSDQAVGERINALVALARQESAAAAEEALRATLHQYPRCAALQLNGALFYDYLQMACPGASEEDKTRWRDEKQTLLRAVWASGGAYRQAAAQLLASAALQAGNLTEAEQYLAEMPEQPGDATLLRASLHLKKNEPAAALSLLQKRLFSLVHQAQSCLTMMAGEAITPDSTRALSIIQTASALEQVFFQTTGAGLVEGMLLEAYLRAGKMHEAAASLRRYVDVLTGPAIAPRPELFAPGVTVSPNRPASGRELRQCLLNALEKGADESLAALAGTSEYREAMEKLRQSLSEKDHGQ